MSNGQQYEKVNWVRQTTLDNGVKLSVSEKSGLVKIEIPGTGRRAILLYRDEALTLFGSQVGIQQYVEANNDVIMSQEAKKAERETSKLKTRTGNFHGAKADLVARLMVAGKTQDEIKQALEIAGFNEPQPTQTKTA